MHKTLKALSDPNRRRILELLKGGRLSAGEIGKHLAIGSPTLSHHLQVLKKAELIDSEKEGTYIYYSINTSVVEDIMVWMSDLLGVNPSEN